MADKYGVSLRHAEPCKGWYMTYCPESLDGRTIDCYTGHFCGCPAGQALRRSKSDTWLEVKVEAALMGRRNALPWNTWNEITLAEWERLHPQAA